MSDRLDRIEAILDRIAQRQEEFDRDWEETKFIVRSNARAIQAAAERHNEFDRDWEERLTKHEESIARLDSVMLRLTDVQEGMAKWLANVDDNQPTILKRLMSIENKIDRILDNDS